MFSEFIKHYDNIREILRDVFLYGCFSREALEEKNGKSTRKLKYEIGRIQQYIGDDFIKEERDGRLKLLNLSYDSLSNTKNFLVETYFSKSFTKTDLILYYYILMVLNYNNKLMSFSEIEDFLIDKELIKYDNISGKTIERKIKELNKEMDIISCEKQGRNNMYKIAKDILKDFTNEEVKILYYVSSLYKNIIIPNMAGYYFSLSLFDYLYFERNINIENKDLFQYKDLHFHPVIEEEILCKLLNAINEEKRINLESNIKSTRKNRYVEEVLKPYKIRYDSNCGRYYLISFNKNNRCVVSRLDRIKDVKVLKEGFKRESLEELYKETMEKSWSSVPKNYKGEHEILELEVIIKNEKEKYILNKIKSEIGEAEIIEGEKGFKILKKVNDCYEMIPWLRSYAGNVKIISPSWLKKKLKADWKVMLESYKN